MHNIKYYKRHQQISAGLFSVRIRTFKISLLISLFLMLWSVACAENHVYMDPNASVEHRVQDLLGRLTLEEKAGFMAGKNMWFMKSVERLAIPSVQMTDCGYGVTVILDGGREVYLGLLGFATLIFRPKLVLNWL